MGRLLGVVPLYPTSRGSEPRQGIIAGITFALSIFILLTGVMVALPVREAVADTKDYGPDGYFSALKDTDGDGKVMPVVDKDNETPDVPQDGWINTRRIMFGKTASSETYNSLTLSGGYKTLGLGAISSIPDAGYVGLQSATTSLLSDEVLLAADHMSTNTFRFQATASCSSQDCNYFDRSGSRSNVAAVSNSVSGKNYSPIEVTSMVSRNVEGVCITSGGCASGSYTAQRSSVYAYNVFPLSTGDLSVYFNIPPANTQSIYANRNIDGTNYRLWLRSANHNGANYTVNVYARGEMFTGYLAPNAALRPALRLKLDNLLLSAHSENQTQVLDDDDSLRLTFADENWSLKDSKLDSVPGTLMVDADEDASIDGYGWKAVDPTAEDGSVFASGFSEDGNIDTSVFPAGKVLDFYFWGQENGSAEKGWSNRATTANRVTIKDGKEYVPRSFGISLTGQTSGTLTAYRIGEYDETLFTQTGALKSVRLDTPEDLGTVLKTAAESAGGGEVDTDNPIGWVASRWLGYPSDPASEDVTSAFSPYAGSLQLFAQQLAKDTDALGASAGSLPKLDGGPETLKVSGPGLYLIVDSMQSSGGSLPIIVGTKVFNEVLGEDGSYVDFVDAGVRGKPRLGQAALKTTVTDIAKRVVNDVGVDGFDVGGSVEYEIALRVPDLMLLDGSVSFDEYVFGVADVAASGLTLPAGGSGVEVFVDALSSTESQSLPPSSIMVSGDTLTVDGLKALFAESDGVSGVKNKNTVPVGSLMRLRYRAVLNASAVVSSPVEGESLKPNANTVTLTRSYTDSKTEGWTDNGNGTESRSATANAYSFTVDVVKLDKDDLSTRLGGVGFEVSRDGELLKFTKLSDGEYRLGDASGTEVVVTKSDGTLSLQGVEARELSFKETNAPSGYFRVSDFTVDIRPVWNEDATQVTKVAYATSGTNLAYVSKDGEQVVVLDPAWSLVNLPYTGGIGILVLLVVGGLMLVFAVRPYILSKRAERDANLV